MATGESNLQQAQYLQALMSDIAQIHTKSRRDRPYDNLQLAIRESWQNASFARQSRFRKAKDTSWT